MLTRFPLSAVNASSVGSKGERIPSVNTADTNEVTFYMKIREYLKSLSFANPQITFAPDFEHYRIYDDFVCERLKKLSIIPGSIPVRLQLSWFAHSTRSVC